MRRAATRAQYDRVADPAGGLLTNMIEDFDRRKEELLNRATMQEVADALGLEPAGKKDRHCPAHNDTRRPNLHLYDKEAHCFACGFHADAFALVAKVKGCDFKASFDFLAGRFGLPLLADAACEGKKGRGRGLGYKAKTTTATVYPKSVKLPDSPSPTFGANNGGDSGNGDRVEGAKPYPNGDDPLPDLPVELWREFDDFASAWAYLDDDQVDGYGRVLGRDPETGRYFVRRPTLRRHRRQSLRVEVFAALLDLATPASATAAGEWLRREKGVEPATQDRFGLRFLDDWKTASRELRDRFGVETLQSVGIYGKQKDGSPYFVFARHGLLFPFFWRGLPVDVQGRNVEAADKGDRFRNTTGANPIPYNADALLEARATGSKVFVCEGATDTLALAQSGRLVVGIVGTGGFKPAWLEAFEGLDVYLALDSDEAGRKAAKTITKLFLDAGHRAPKVVKLPEGVKDVNQFFRSNAK